MTATVDALRYPEDGVCYQTEEPGFFPSTEDPDNPAVMAIKDRYCFRCPVRQQCLDEALDKQSDWGIFGGTTGEERRPMRKTRRQNHAPTGTRRKNA